MKRTSSIHVFRTLFPCNEHNRFTKLKKKIGTCNYYKIKLVIKISGNEKIN